MRLRPIFSVVFLMPAFDVAGSTSSSNKFSLKDAAEPNNASAQSQIPPQAPQVSQPAAQPATSSSVQNPPVATPSAAPAAAPVAPPVTASENPQANTQPATSVSSGMPSSTSNSTSSVQNPPVAMPSAAPAAAPVAPPVTASANPQANTQPAPMSSGMPSSPSNGANLASPVPTEQPQAMPLPAAQPQPVAPSEPENQLDIQESMDTIESDDEGNWLLKRVWWEHAEDLFGKIISLNDKIVQAQINLINKRNDLDKRVTETFKSLEIDQVKLSDSLEYIYTDVAAISETPELADEKALFEKFNKYKDSLDKINQALNDIQEQENLLSESMIQLMKLVNECRGYESSSWKNFKEIGRILNDEKAKELFYQVDAAHKNVQQYLAYINGELSSFINKAMGNISNLVDQVSQELSSLKSQDAGVDSFINEHKNIIEKKKRLKEQEEQKQKATVKKKKAPQGFFARVSSWFGSVFTSIKNFFGFGK